MFSVFALFIVMECELILDYYALTYIKETIACCSKRTGEIFDRLNA
jgi:hypothetical protein